MRIFIAFEGLCEPIDISQDQTVSTVKLLIKDYFHVQLSDNKQGHRFLELSYAGATLEDDWVLADMGIMPSCTIKCVLKEEDKPVLHVYNAVTRETIPIMGSIFLLTTTVSSLKSLVSLKCGLPVSMFRLSTQWGVEIYSCNKLDDYKMDAGTTLRLDVWDGWSEFLRGCFLGHICTIRRKLSEEEPISKFQQRVALHLAAFFGHLELAGWLLKKGGRADEPVGVHPYRAWCRDTDHPDIRKCPVHVAAEAGQLLILKFFINNNLLCLEVPDPQGLNPLQICIKHKHKHCVLYFVTKMWSVVSYPGLSLPIGAYLKIKGWLCKARKQIAARKLLSKTATFNTRVGDIVLIDGFTPLEMTSKPKRKANKAGAAERSCALPTLPQTQGQKENNLFPLCSKSSQNIQSPQVQAAGRAPEKLRNRKVKSRKTMEILSGENRNRNRNVWKSRVPLPPISRDTNPRPQFIYTSPNASFILTSSLESFYEHSGRTPRENAIYCLALASAFKEKPWLQQLGMARSLARRAVLKPV
ncbi:protein ANKUB1-like [Acipenser ruthenus]|uniref:protein ANKUB1-like n=1 Tax=Acipenser ruthenus TaxID=7906 RepID=UPI002740EB88|nr:protein ANKUB1-like [Acipenser ruthenus]